MGDEHLNTILTTKLDEFIKSCVKNLVPNPSESEGENGCDVLACFTTFSNILFEADYESDSSDYQSCSDEDFLEEIFSNPLFEEEIISTKIDPHHFDAESDLLESMLNRDSFIISSSLKIDSLLDEFAEFVSENSDANIESFFPSPIPDENSDSHIEEIDLTFTPDDPIPPSIKDDDNDSERDVLILKELPSNYSLSLPKIKSFYFDIPSFSRPPYFYPLDQLNIPGNVKTLTKGFYPPSLHFLSFNWESKFVSENSNAEIESFSPSPIPVEDNDSFMEEIDLSFNLDDLMPSGIKEDDNDSKRDILILKELLDNYSLSLPII
nr:hypothetical protein [Tanacetum cinerariifolium]